MGEQLELRMDVPGAAARPLVPAETIRRFTQNHRMKPGYLFYILSAGSHLMMWSGKGRMPQWVRDWQRGGGSIHDLEARI